MAEAGGQEETEHLIPNYPLIRYTDLPELSCPEIVDYVASAIERYTENLEEASKSIKEEMDRLYGTFWHVVIGEDFGYEVTHETTNLLFMFFGKFGVLVFKCR